MPFTGLLEMVSMGNLSLATCRIYENIGPQIPSKHVLTADNPVDLASRGGNVTNAELWWNGPTWLSDPEMWPENPLTLKTKASEEEEARVTREVLSLGNEKSKQEPNVFDDLL